LLKNAEDQILVKMDTDKQILVVEDNASLRRLVLYHLRKAKYQVQEAQNGRAAVKLLQQSIPDLILLDLRMPIMDGFELLNLTRRYPKAAAIPIIALSALSEDEDIERALRLGVLDYLIKPLDPSVLLSRVGALLRPRRGSWTGDNRREFLRGSILNLELADRQGVDLSESGISYNTNQPPLVGELVSFEVPQLSKTLALPPIRLRCRVVYVRRLGRSGFRVGAVLVGLNEMVRSSIRRYVLERQTRSVLS